MPKLLGFIFGLFAITSYSGLLVAFIPWPGATYTLNDRELSYLEYWTTGMAPGFLLYMLIIAFTSYGLTRGRQWSRWVVQIYWSLIFFLPSYGSIIGFGISSLLTIAFAYYMFKSKGVANYFEQAAKNA